MVETVGVALASEDVPRLRAWYKELGIPFNEHGYCLLGGASPDEGGMFTIQAAATRLPAAPPGDVTVEPYGLRRATLDFRVRDLAEVVAGLRARGDKVAGPQDYGYGTFAWVHDPDGNVVQLWQQAT